MRQFTKATLFMALSAIALTSCSDESPWSGPSGEGAVKLNFSSDGRVMRQTRADDSLSPVVPDGSAFTVNFAKSDGSYSKNWSSVDAFNREKSFPIGDYTLTASYGSIDVEGFDNPYYLGSNRVHVSPGATTDVNVTATLANAMVSVRYTDAFRENFSAYSAAVQTEGHDWVVFAQNEDRPAYVAPSADVKLNLTLTNDAGERVTIQPAGFTAVARHHYVVTIGVTGNAASGNLALDVEFDEDVVSETVNVSLGDELFSAPAPTVTAKGFTPETEVGNFEYSELKETPEFHVFAFGGLKSATLNVVAENGYSPVFGRSVEFVNADNLTMQQLEQEGVAGYFRNADKMGVVNVKKFLERLPAGKYEIEVQAVDVMTRTSEPLKLTAVITPLEIQLAPAAQAAFMGSEVTVDLTTNSPELKNVVAFKVPDAHNKMVDAEIKSVTDITASGASVRAGSGYVYRYVLALEPSFRSEIDVEMSVIANRNKKATTKVLVGAPEYTMVPDAFSNRVVLKIESENPAVVKALVDNLQFFNGEAQVPSANITHDSANGMITVSGLTPAIKYVSLKAVCGTFEKTVPEFTTEIEEAVPNGDFSEVSNTINIDRIKAGGQYKYGLTTMQNWSSINVDEPNAWASVNKKTAYAGAANQNTWFVVPSTLASNGEVVVRSVAYDHSGSDPALDNHGLNVLKKYSRNAPASFASKASGELFLGSYSYDGTEHREDGISFPSRPSSVSFDYKYAPVSNESASVEVAVLDSEGAAIASGTLTLGESQSYKNQTVSLSYNAGTFGKKAAKLQICFKSTKNENVSVPVPTNLEDVSNTTSLSGQTIATNAYKSLCVGSVLTIDNVKLGYGSSTTTRAAKSRR